MAIRGFEALAVEALRDLRREKDAQIEALQSSLDAQARRIAALEEATLDGSVPSSTACRRPACRS